MQAPVEVRYAGIVVGRAQEVRSDDDASTFFLPGKEPMPVGTVVQLRSGDRETSARVLRAVESADPAVAGMKVRLIGDSETVLPDWIPSPAPAAKVSTKGGTPTPAVEVNLGLMQTEMPVAPAVLDAVKLAKVPAAEVSAPEAEVPPPVAEPSAPAAQPSAPAPAPEATAAPVPEAVPVAVGSSLTGALEKAAQESIVTEAAVEPAQAAAKTEADKDTQEVATMPATETSSGEVAANGAAEADGENGASNGEAAPTTEDMPAARPIAGPSGRRKTKRRR
jgi:hypothetical protein